MIVKTSSALYNINRDQPEQPLITLRGGTDPDCHWYFTHSSSWLWLYLNPLEEAVEFIHTSQLWHKLNYVNRAWGHQNFWQFRKYFHSSQTFFLVWITAASFHVCLCWIQKTSLAIISPLSLNSQDALRSHTITSYCLMVLWIPAVEYSEWHFGLYVIICMVPYNMLKII